jgi:hypothetical protein
MGNQSAKKGPTMYETKDFIHPFNVAQGQLQTREKYGHDCLYGFFYAPVEVEAFGAEVIYFNDGPPNSGTPFIQDPETIRPWHPLISGSPNAS